MYCGNCGTRLPDDTKFCQICGSAQENTRLARRVIEYVTETDAGDRVCRRCGSALRPGAAFCGTCGQQLPEKITYRMPLCTVCGTKLPLSAPACTFCSTPYRVDDDGYIDVPQQTLCTACGAPVADNVDFCTACGTKADRSTVVIKKMLPVCRRCGREVNPGGLFCTQCGEKWNMSKRNIVKPVRLQSPSEAGKIMCPVCDKLQADSRKRCFYCGVTFQTD